MRRILTLLLLLVLAWVPAFGRQNSINIAIPDTVVWASETLTSVVTANDGNGNPISVTMREAPVGAEFDQATGIFSWLPANPQIGAFEFSATDGLGRMISAQLLVLAQGDLFPGLGADQLPDALRRAFSPIQTLGYEVARDSMFASLDLHDDGYVRGIYTGFKVLLTEGDPSTVMFNAGIKAEHLWPQSKGAGEEPQRSDLYHLYPAKSNVDSARSNKPFVEIPDNETDKWYRFDNVFEVIPSESIAEYSESALGRWEPRENVKGDVARAVMYFNLIYPASSDSDFYRSMYWSLISWPFLDEVSIAEVRRALIIQGWQGNLSPFLFDPNLTVRLLPNPPVSIENPEQAEFGGITVYPNPAYDIVYIDYAELTAMEVTELKVFDILGRLVYSEYVSLNRSQSATLDVSGFKPGLYFITTFVRNTVQTSRFVVK